MEQIINKLKEQISNSDELGCDRDQASWGYEQGVLLTVEEAEKIVNKLSQLLEAETKPANGGHREIVTYILEQLYRNGEWYESAEYETLEEAKEIYEKLETGRIVEKKTTVTLLFKRG